MKISSIFLKDMVTPKLFDLGLLEKKLGHK
jgi:hypothetical protein